MSKKVNFYMIAFYRGNHITDLSVYDFLMNINDRVFGGERGQIVRYIGDKWLRLFRHQLTYDQHKVVIPFGKLKDKNKPYWLNGENVLEEIPAELYDINSLGYDRDYNVALFTTNREGPSISMVKEYLNTYVPNYTGLELKIEPIMYNAGIEKVRNASLVTGVTLNLDLGQTLNEFYINEMEENDRGLVTAFRQIAEAAKNDAEGKTLSLSVGIGQGKKHDTLNLDSMLFLLEHINIGGEFVKEIIVKYKEGEEDKIDKAQLKESNMLLAYTCQCEGSQVSPEALVLNIYNAVADNIITITRHRGDYFAGILHYTEDMFEVVLQWDNGLN